LFITHYNSNVSEFPISSQHCHC